MKDEGRETTLLKFFRVSTCALRGNRGTHHCSGTVMAQNEARKAEKYSSCEKTDIGREVHSRNSEH